MGGVRDLRMGNRCREGDVVKDSTVQHKYRECEGLFCKNKECAKIQRGMPNVASTAVLYEFVTADKLEG